MKNVKELSRQMMYNEDEGMSCGPCGITAIDAEIILEDDGEKVYLHGQWIDEVGDHIFYEATTSSTYEIYEKLHRGEGNFDDLIAERDKRVAETSISEEIAQEKYGAFFQEIEKMILEELNNIDIECALTWEEEE